MAELSAKVREHRRRRYLRAMGIPRWELRGGGDGSAAPESGVAPAPVTPPVKGGDSLPVERLPWEELKARVATCTLCPLHEGRTQAVFGVGDPEAEWMVIGEAPGADEDRQGEPFVGRAGGLLNAMLRSVGLEREAVYIANIVKCRPPKNRDPRPEETHSCMPYLHRQVDLIQPRLILAVGRVAAQNLLNTDQPIGRMRGRVYQFGAREVPLVVTYHPAYLLRSPLEKAKVWKDLQLARRTYLDAAGSDR